MVDWVKIYEYISMDTSVFETVLLFLYGLAGACRSVERAQRVAVGRVLPSIYILSMSIRTRNEKKTHKPWYLVYECFISLSSFIRVRYANFVF